MSEIRSLKEFSPTIGTLYHSFISVICGCSVIKLFNFFQSPILFVIYHFNLFLSEFWSGFSFCFGFLFLLNLKFLDTLRIMYLETSESKLSTTDATFVKENVHVNVRGFEKLSFALCLSYIFCPFLFAHPFS